MIGASEAIVAEAGYEALRVEEVVARAGVAKGTFFAHFRDKDALMEQLLGARINGHLDDIEALEPPQNVDALIDALMPLIGFMTTERYVFDVILRHSGAAAKEEIGDIAQTFWRMGTVMGPWLAQGPFRKDISAALLADGVGAFLIQAMALHFCALHNEEPLRNLLERYLTAWLLPKM
ncbi:MAG: TetR/AcrR family transcriptional regulator [Cognatishimia sp.]